MSVEFDSGWLLQEFPGIVTLENVISIMNRLYAIFDGTMSVQNLILFGKVEKERHHLRNAKLPLSICLAIENYAHQFSSTEKEVVVKTKVFNRGLTRPHELFIETNMALMPDPTNLARVIQFFERYISPDSWTKTPKYELGKTYLNASCGSRCGSLKNKKSIFALSLHDGKISRFTDLCEATTHSENCRANA
jgi:hypothetical protein